MLKVIWKIFLDALPALIMVGLIGLTHDDVLLAAVFTGIIALALIFRYDKYDIIFLLFGFIVFPLAEFLFVSTGVEVFARPSLLGIMPLWLPFLWAYTFVAVKRGVLILDKYLRRRR